MASCIVWLLEALFAEPAAFLPGTAGCASTDGSGRRNGLLLAPDDGLLPFTREVADRFIGRLWSRFAGDPTIFTEFTDAARATRDAADRVILSASEVRAA